MPKLKHFDTLYEVSMHLISEGYSMQDFINGLRAVLYKDEKTVYAGRILQNMNIIVINDMNPTEVDYEDTDPNAYRVPIHKRIYGHNEMPTMAVDPRGNLYVGEQFLSKEVFGKYGTQVGTEMVKAILIHESMHISELTFFRGIGKAGQPWNIATDAFINYHITKNGYPLPEGGIIPDANGDIQIKFQVAKGLPPKIFVISTVGKSSEMLYDDILKIFKETGNQPPPPPPPSRPLQRGDPVYNVDTKEYGVVIGLKPIKVRKITKEEAKVLAQKAAGIP